MTSVSTRIWKQDVQICYSLKNRLSKYVSYNTSLCVLHIKQGVHLANGASKRHPKVLLANTLDVTCDVACNPKQEELACRRAENVTTPQFCKQKVTSSSLVLQINIVFLNYLTRIE